MKYLILMGYRDYFEDFSFFGLRKKEQKFFSGDIFGRASYTKSSLRPHTRQAKKITPPIYPTSPSPHKTQSHHSKAPA